MRQFQCSSLNFTFSNKFKEDPYFLWVFFAEPTGLLIDSAMKLVLPHIPEASVAERREALLRASNHALKRGVTTVVDFGRYFPGVSPECPWEDFSGFSSNKIKDGIRSIYSSF